MATGLTKKDFLTKVFRENNLTKEDFFKHQHYTIITRSGIEKIQANNKIVINYILEKCEANFCVVKAIAKRDNAYVETYGSALKGSSHNDGSTNTWYVAEMAEKRAFSRGVLKIMGLYEHGIMGADESEDFKKG